MSLFDVEEAPECVKCNNAFPWIVEVRGVYDGGLYWECPACGHMWPRFREGTKMHRIALEHIALRKQGAKT